MFVFFPLSTPEKQTCLTAPVETCQSKHQTMSYNTYNITSLTNHWQKAGPIHSLAWTPQSIHTAFFWWRFFFPIWQGQKHHDQSGMCAFVCLCGIILRVCLLIIFPSYLEHIKLSPLVRLPNGEHVDQVGLGSVHFKHPALDLNGRRGQID